MGTTDMLMEIQTQKDNNVLTWRDSSRYFHNEFEYGVQKDEMQENQLAKYIIFIYKNCVQLGEIRVFISLLCLFSCKI